MEDGSNPWTWLIFFYVNHIYVFLDSQKNTIVLRYYLYLMDFLQEKMQHSKKRNIYIQKDFQVQISKIWRVARKSNPPIFLHVGFFEAPSFFVLVYHHPKGKAPIVFYMFFSISMGVSIYIYIYCICLHICHHESLSPTYHTNPSPTASTPSTHQSRSCLISKGIHTTTQGELGCKDSTDLALGNNPSKTENSKYVGHVVVLLFALKKGWLFVGNPETTPTKKRKEKVGIHGKNPWK